MQEKSRPSTPRQFASSTTRNNDSSERNFLKHSGESPRSGNTIMVNKHFGTLQLFLMFAIFGIMLESVHAQQTGAADKGEIERFTADIARHPDDADAYLGRGRAFVSQSRFDMARADFTKAAEVATHPYYVSQARMGRGEVYIAQANYPLAIADFGEIIEMKTAPVYKAAAYRNRADAYHRKGDSNLALADIDEAVSLSSKMKTTGWKKRLAKAYELRAAINCGMGNKAAAAADEKKLTGLGSKVKNKCRAE